MKARRLAVWALLGVVGCGGADKPAVPPAIELPVGPEPKPVVASVQGVWLGTLHAGGKGLRVQFRVDPEGHTCALDSLDQGGFGIPCTYVEGQGGALSFEVAAVKGAWSGKRAADGASLVGTWTQGGVGTELTLVKQAAAAEMPKAHLDPALPPVGAAGLRAVIDADLKEALDHGELAPATAAGVTIGVVDHGQRVVWSYGTAKVDSLFEIGSISKTFTGLLLAQMVAQKKARLDEPVRELLPPGTVEKPASGAELTLLDLSDQHSGLPRMPDNFTPASEANPYADYNEKALFGWLGKHGVGRSPDAPFGYSNLGVGLLGHALAKRAGVSYETLLRQEITGPLGLHDTVVAIPPRLRPRLLPGHDAQHKPVHGWDLDALVGAGGIRSTAGDMLTYLEAQLHPEKLPASAKASPQGKTLPAAITETHVLHGESLPGMHIGLNWFHVDDTGTYWHNGATGGYTSNVLFTPSRDFAVVVLSNTGPGAEPFADALAKHIAQRLRGTPAMSLSPAP